MSNTLQRRGVQWSDDLIIEPVSKNTVASGVVAQVSQSEREHRELKNYKPHVDSNRMLMLWDNVLPRLHITIMFGINKLTSIEVC